MRRQPTCRRISGRPCRPSSSSRRTPTGTRRRRTRGPTRSSSGSSAARRRCRISSRRRDPAYQSGGRGAGNGPAPPFTKGGVMAKIPESYLPPPELRPKRIYNLDEFKNIPQKFNSTEVLLDQTAAKYGDKVAIYFDEQRVTYKQLQASVNRVANGLKKLGVGEGDSGLMRMPNIPPIIVCNLAITKIG